MFGVKIKGTGSFLPKKKINNFELYKKINNFDIDRAKESLSKKNINEDNSTENEIFDHWVQMVSGIESRHVVSDQDSFRDHYEVEGMAYQASLNAIASSGIDKNEIESIILTSFTPTTLIPNSACTLTDLLGLTNCSGITLNTACSGFLDGLMDAYAKIAAGLYKTVLVVSSEYISKEISLDDPTTAILFSDGAGACILKRSEENHMLGFFSKANYSDQHLNMYNGNKLKMGGGPLVQRNAVNAMYESALQISQKTGLGFNDFDYIIPHQANLRIMRELARKMELTDHKMIETVQSVGNTSCATIPISLDLLCRGKLNGFRYKDKSKILCTSVGGGYTYAACAFVI